MGGYTTANYIWDLLQSRKINPSLPAVEAYYKGLKVIDTQEIYIFIMDFSGFCIKRLDESQLCFHTLVCG